MSIAKKETFKAWIDKMPGSPPKLIVQGDGEVNSGGWTVTLDEAKPQGINPNIKLLVVNAIAPKDRATTVMTPVKLRYVESPPHHEYTQVTIRDGKDSFTINVGETS